MNYDKDEIMYSISDLKSDMDYFEKEFSSLKSALDYALGEINYRVSLLEFDTNKNSDKTEIKINEEELEKFVKRQQSERLRLNNLMEEKHND